MPHPAIPEADFDPRAFAARVLFATDLDAKLGPPAPAELQPGRIVSGFAAPSEPGRPAALRFKTRSERARPLPATAALIDDLTRARLLHFFCNHELLAVELMALALLKFPRAPAAFRREVFQTLLEEQRHTRWYLQRMRSLGLEFGSQPLSRMIWDAIAPMTSPLDYVSRLSLTFEQANLDYALHFHRLFKDAGDPESAAILGRIYRDEIGHVRTGLRWLRAFKQPGQDDLAAWTGRLRAPLSALRARGNVPLFNAEGRARAGLDPAFIDAVRHAAGPRGRDPDLWSMDPLAELRWSGAPVPPRLEVLGRNLEGVLFCFASAADLVAVRHAPGPAARRRWADHGLTLAGTLDPATPPEQRPAIRRPQRWAPDPAAAPPAWRALFDKHTPGAWLGGFRAELGLRADPDLALTLHRDAAALIRTVESHFAGGRASARAAGPLVLKARFGASGQGVRRLDRVEDLDRHRRWIELHCRADAPSTGLLLGRWLNVVREGSVHFEVHPDGRLLPRGLAWTECGPGGRFRAALAGPRPLADPGLGAELRRFLHEGRDDEPAPRAWFAALLPRLLQPRLAALDFHGPLGIDFLLHRRADGGLALHPLNDLNPRRSFGRAALEVQRRLGGRLQLRIGTAGEERQAGRPEERLPLSFDSSADHRLWIELNPRAAAAEEKMI